MGSRISKKVVKKAILDSGGILLIISKRAGIPWSTFHDWVHKPKQEDMRNLIENEKEKLLDLAEAKLMKKVNDGEDWAIKWILSTLGKNRGYTEKQEIEYEGINNIEVTFVMPDDKKTIRNVTPNEKEITENNNTTNT